MIALSSCAICADHKRKMGKSEGRGGVHVFTRPSSVGWHNQVTFHVQNVIHQNGGFFCSSASTLCLIH